MNMQELEQYTKVIIPNIERELTIEKDPTKLTTLYDLYRDVLYLVGPHDFITYNKALELDDDKTDSKKGFYHHRQHHLKEMFEAFNDMEIHDKYDILLISMPPRTGKEQPLSAKILTPYGWKTMGEMTVGQEVMGEDGQIHRVTGVFPQGVKQTYDLVFNNGLRVPCGIDHLWKVKTTEDCRNPLRTTHNHHIMTTKQIMEYMEKNPNLKLRIPPIKPMDYPTTIDLEKYDMYSLGVAFADGAFPFKAIPDRYLFCDKESRLDLLKGIMDRAGRVGRTSMNDAKLLSYEMAESVCELVRSFGGQAKIRQERSRNTKFWMVYWNLFEAPFYCEHKIKRFTPFNQIHGNIIKAVEPRGLEECWCISVDNPTHMYVTDGYTQTHNTTTGIRFLSWIMGRHPESTQLATAFSDAITCSFYLGAMEIIGSEHYNKVFPESKLVSQNAKREEIWLKVMKRYPSITFAPVGGSVTGRCEAELYLYCDDLVSGSEEAMNLGRLDKLWTLYSNDFTQRKKEGCKEIHLATPWSVHDPITKLRANNADNPRAKSIIIPAYDEFGESNFAFPGGFSSKFYHDLEKDPKTDALSFKASYMGEPIEREGLLYNEADMQTYFTLPSEPPDTIIAVCDSKGAGKDFVASPVGYVYGDFVYIDGVVFNNGLPAVTIKKVADLWYDHKVVRGDIEMNNGGGFYAENVDKELKKLGSNASVRTFFTSSNKNTKIITYADFVTKFFIFRDPSTYSKNSEYAKFMANVYAWSQTTKQQVDDAPDSLAMLANLFQNLSGNKVKILDRKKLGM